jgi:transposase
MVNCRTASTYRATQAQRRQTRGEQPRGLDRYRVHSQDRLALGILAPGDGLWFRHDLLAALERMATGRCMGGFAPRALGATAPGRWLGLVACGAGFFERARSRRLFKQRERSRNIGPNSIDRARPCSKHHLLTDANGVPLAALVSAANANDITQLWAWLEAVPPVRGQRGRPRRRPKKLLGDRAYDSQPHRNALQRRGITPRLARRGVSHGSGLGQERWPVERSIGWLHNARRLRVRYDRHDFIHEALMKLQVCLICHARLRFC